MQKILINDGNRHMKSTGYGQLARSIILSLKRHTEFEVIIQKRLSTWDDVPNKEELLEVKESNKNDHNVTLKVGAPANSIIDKTPTLWYTQNALGELKKEWVNNLKIVNGIIVPGKFDAEIFKRHLENIFICPQVIDQNVFKPILKYRDEGANELSFLFVGSYGYRKGVDLLFKFFKKAFKNHTRVSLTLHCFTGLEGNGINHLLSHAKDLPSNIKLRVFNGSVSPAWMNRIYNRHDVIVTFSRGEGWCMPLHEALSCGKPVIAPNSTAMGEALPDFGVRKVKVNKLYIDDITDPFGKSMINGYGGESNYLWEPDEDDAINALVDVCENYKDYALNAIRGREFILKSYSLETMSKSLCYAINKVCNKDG